MEASKKGTPAQTPIASTSNSETWAGEEANDINSKARAVSQGSFAQRATAPHNVAAPSESNKYARGPPSPCIVPGHRPGEAMSTVHGGQGQTLMQLFRGEAINGLDEESGDSSGDERKDAKTTTERDI